MALTHRAGCACVVCTHRTSQKMTRVCISVPESLWQAFGDECLLAGAEKSPTVAKLVQLWLRHRKNKGGTS